MERPKGGIPFDTDAGRTLDPATLSFIERISWFERQRPIEADNDNATARPEADHDSACFESWALPDFMRN